MSRALVAFQRLLKCIQPSAVCQEHFGRISPKAERVAETVANVGEGGAEVGMAEDAGNAFAVGGIAMGLRTSAERITRIRAAESLAAQRGRDGDRWGHRKSWIAEPVGPKRSFGATRPPVVLSPEFAVVR